MARRWVEYYEMSNGYIEGSIPPRFSEDARKPIPMVASDSVRYLDGRWSLQSCITAARTYANDLMRRPVGFKIMVGERLSTSRPLTDLILLKEELTSTS